MTSRRSASRIGPILQSVVAIAALLVVVIGVPLALIYFVGWPVPSPRPTMNELGDIFAGRAPIPGDYLVSVLAVIMWLLWTQFVLATAVEVAAAIKGRLASRAPVLPGVQNTAGKLVAAATLLAASMTSKPVAAGPLVPVAVDQDIAEVSTSPEQAPDAPQTGRPQPYMTSQGDTWWGIAEETLGAGTRWKELRGLNIGRTMDDGSTISAATDLLKPNWRLLLPSTASVTPAVVEVKADNPRQVTVEPGDTIWAIAEDDLVTPSGDTEVAEHVDRIADINASKLEGNPDMIYPGQVLGLPDAQTESESAPALQPVEPDSEPEIDASPPAIGPPAQVERPTGPAVVDQEARVQPEAETSSADADADDVAEVPVSEFPPGEPGEVGTDDTRAEIGTVSLAGATAESHGRPTTTTPSSEVDVPVAVSEVSEVPAAVSEVPAAVSEVPAAVSDLSLIHI